MSTITRAHRQAARGGRYLLADRTQTTATNESREAQMQRMTLVLHGITAADYLCWVRDPDPAVLGRDLRQLDMRAEPLGDQIELQLLWDGEPPAPAAAATAAGFPLTQDVLELLAQPLAAPARRRGPRTRRTAMRSARVALAVTAAAHSLLAFSRG